MHPGPGTGEAKGSFVPSTGRIGLGLQRDAPMPLRRLVGAIEGHGCAPAEVSAEGDRGRERESRALHRLCAQTRGCASVIDPHSGRFLDVNETTCLVSGYTRREFLRLSVADIDPTVSASWSYAREINARRDTETLLREGVIRRKDGGLVRVSVSSTIVQLHLENYMLACAKQFPDKKPSGDESSVFDTMDSGVLVTALDGTIRDLNASAERLFGLTRALIIGKNVATLPALRGERPIPPSASRTLERGKQ